MNFIQLQQDKSCFALTGIKPGMSMQEKSDRLDYAAHVAAGDASFRIPENLAIVLMDGNETGYADGLAKRPAQEFDTAVTDPIFIRGYQRGYKMALQGKLPQCVQLRELGLTGLLSCKYLEHEEPT